MMGKSVLQQVKQRSYSGCSSYLQSNVEGQNDVHGERFLSITCVFHNLNMTRLERLVPPDCSWRAFSSRTWIFYNMNKTRFIRLIPPDCSWRAFFAEHEFSSQKTTDGLTGSILVKYPHHFASHFCYLFVVPSEVAIKSHCSAEE